jgi:hypothetical protein
MTVELHEGVVAFKPLTPGRENILLGRIHVGEISPTVDPLSRYPFCYRLVLPEASSRAWQPARDVIDARRQAIEKINDWMIAAGLRPIGNIS